MIRVAIVTPRYPPVSSGGGEQSTKLLATQLAKQDDVDNVTVFAFDGSTKTVHEGVHVQRLGTVSPFITELQNLSAIPKLNTRLAEFDVIHAYNMELHPAVGYLSDREDVPSVATLNSYHFFPKSVTNTSAKGIEWIYERIGMPTTGRILRHYMKRIDAFVALSRAIEEIYREHSFDDARIEYVPNMIDPDFQVPDSAVTSGTQLLYVGTLTENKGVRYLLDALSLLPEQYELRIVGDGNCRDDLQTYAVDLGITERTEFSGWIPYAEVGQVYSEADVFVHPGIWPEPLNRTVLEAMQAELPVVCTDIGGPPEVIPDKEMLCEPANPEALATAVRRVKDRADDIGIRNRRYVEEKHAPSVVVPQIVDLYKCITS